MIYQKEMEINTMVIDATFWVAISFIIFFIGLIYLKIPQKINEVLNKLIIELNDKFHKSSELKKNLAENKINQMKEKAIKEIKDASIKVAVDSVKKIITTSVDNSKLDTLFQKNLDETKEELKKINL